MSSNYNYRKQYFGLILFLSLVTFSYGQTLISDKSDYYPGELATFYGSDFAANEVVDLVVLHHDETPNSGENHEHWEAQADENGSFVTTWIVCTDDCLGSTLRAYATGLTSNLQAWVEFTDANVKFSLSGIAGYTGNVTINYRVYTNGIPSGSFTAITVLYTNPSSMIAIAVSNTQTIEYNTNSVIYNGNSYTSSPSSAIGANNGNGAQTIPITFSSTCTLPTITCPTNISTSSETTSCGKSVSFAATATGTSPTITYKIGTTPTIVTITSPYVFPIGTTTVTATATNSCGNASCTFTVTVNDTTAPLISNSGLNKTISCPSQPIFDIPTATDNCDQNPQIIEVSDITTLGNCLGTYSRVKSWKAKDASGNESSTISQTINVIDTTAPVTPSAPPTASYQCMADVPSAQALSTSDNCGSTVSGSSSDSVNSSDPCHVVITRTWTFTDSCNNSSSVSQTINVIDTTAPVTPSAPPTASYQCMADVPSAQVLSASDNCGSTVSGSSSDSVNSSDPCHVVITRTWTFTDSCNNSSSVSQTINVIDTTAPVAPSAPPTASYQCMADVPSAQALSALDNCGSTVSGSSSDSVNSSDPCHVVITRTWTFTDSCNNSSSVSQTINVIDTTAPVAPSAPPTVSYQCMADVPSAQVLSASDNCGSTVSGSSSDSVNSSDPCHVVITRTWTFTDSCNNSSSVSQTINVIDTTAPVAPSAPPTASYQCMADVPSAQALSALDNCGSTVSGSSSDSVNSSDPCHVVITRTWTLTDSCNNSSSVSQTINVIDTTAPVAPSAPPTASYQCMDDVPSAQALSASDNCGSTVSGSSSDSVNSSDPCHVVITRTWTFTDSCNNSSSVSQTINVIDTIAPVAPSAPPTASYQCMADVPSAQVLSASDNCGSTVSGSSSDSVNSSDPCHVVITRTWTFTDSCNNSSSVSQTINVIDTIAPTFTKPTDITIYTDTNCGYNATVSITGDVINEADNCSTGIQATFTDSVTNGTCQGSKIITRTWALSDNCSNSAASQIQTITVLDNTAPTFTKPIDITIYTNANCGYDATISITGDVINEADNCSTGIQATFTDAISNGTCQGSKIITRTWTLSDNCGNSAASQIQTITVLDNTAPTFTKPIDITIYTNSSCGYNSSISITGDVTNETDNCSTGIQATFTDAISNGTCQGSKIITRTWTLSDNCGNYASNQIQTITVSDNTPPTITCPPNVSNLISDVGSCSATLTTALIGTASSSDSCSTPIITWVRSDGASNITAPYPLGTTTITWTAKDNCNNQTSCTQTIQVTKIAPSIVVSTNVPTQQYSDLVNFSAQLTTCSEYSIGGTVTFKLGSTILGTVPVSNSGLAVLPNIPMLFIPGTYTVTAIYNCVSPYLSATGTSSLIITCEDALAYYTGSTYVSTSSETSSSAIVTLSATIKDISAMDNTDANFGNITNAKVTFVNRDNNNAIIASNIPIGLVSVGDTKVGTATYNWNTTISGDSQSITIGIIISGYYCRNNEIDDEIVTISKPLGDLFITGGGYLVLNSSSGIKAGSFGTKNNYGFNVKYNKNKTSLQGNINTIIRRLESDGMHIYQIKGNSMTSLSVITTCPKKATFVGKANIQDITNPLNVIGIEGNATLQVTMTDNGEPGNYDKIGITVWNKNGGLWYSSNWNGTTTVEQTIGGGNLKVHGGSICGNTPLVKYAENVNLNAEKIEFEKPQVTIWPNPSNSEFNLEVSNKIDNLDINMEIFDQNGRLIQKSTFTEEKLNFGLNLQSGLYFIKITHGDFQETKRVLKN